VNGRREEGKKRVYVTSGGGEREREDEK